MHIGDIGSCLGGTFSKGGTFTKGGTFSKGGILAFSWANTIIPPALYWTGLEEFNNEN